MYSQRGICIDPSKSIRPNTPLCFPPHLHVLSQLLQAVDVVVFASVTGVAHWCAALLATAQLWPMDSASGAPSPDLVVGGLCVALLGAASLMAALTSGAATQVASKSTRTRNLPVVAALDVFVTSNTSHPTKSLTIGGERDRWQAAAGDGASSYAGSDGDSTPSRFSAVDDSSLLDEADEALLLGAGQKVHSTASINV